MKKLFIIHYSLFFFAAALLLLTACEKPEDPQSETYASLVSVTDNSIDEWVILPAEFVKEAKCMADAELLGLKSVKVYADNHYINLLVEPNMDDIVDRTWVPFHIYLNTDNSDATGGFGDRFTDANTDIMLEGAIFTDGWACNYDPAVFTWHGAIGGNGWEWTTDGDHNEDDCYGALVCAGNGIANSQFINGKIEIQILRSAIPANWSSENKFGIGVDIYQFDNLAGILPNASPTDSNPNGYTNKLTIEVDDH